MNDVDGITLGTILLVLVPLAGLGLALLLVRNDDPFQTIDPNAYTIAYLYDNKVNLLKVRMKTPTEAEEKLNLYEQAYGDETMLYRYQLIGVLKGHVEWSVYNE